MNRKRNVSYIKPEDPEFLKVLKRQAGYDERNHKFDELQNAEDDFANDEDYEKPQVVVLKEGDLTAEEADVEQAKIEKKESETKADLNQRIIFSAKPKANKTASKNITTKKVKDKKTSQLLSFDVDDEEEDDL